MVVGRLEVFPASECGGEHEHGRFWGVEVCDESVYDLEFKTWVNEDVVFAFGFASFTPEFKSAGNGGADSDYAVAGSLGFLDRF